MRCKAERHIETICLNKSVPPLHEYKPQTAIDNGSSKLPRVMNLPQSTQCGKPMTRVTPQTPLTTGTRGKGQTVAPIICVYRPLGNSHIRVHFALS